MLSMTDIHTYYGSIHALKGVTLTVNQGEIVTLIGANGAGKTTSLMSVSGVTQPKQGKIVFLGEDITKMTTEKIVAKGITQVPEGRMIFPRLTVRENLLMGAYLRNDKDGVKADEEKVYELFPKMHERMKQHGGTLSGGEQQMLAIGRALMARPKLLLLDEPSLGLAPIVVENIFEIIQRINREGTTILLVEQNVAFASGLADRHYIVELGRVVDEIPGRELDARLDTLKTYLGL